VNIPIISRYGLKNYVKTAIKYALNSSYAAVINLGLLYFFTHYLHVWYLYAGMMSTVLSSIPFFYGLIKSKVVVIHKKVEYLTKPARNMAISLLGYGINWSLLYLLTSYLHLFYVLSEFLAMIIVFVLFSFNANVAAKVVEIHGGQAGPTQSDNHAGLEGC
jgi:putative flippase GtrA